MRALAAVSVRRTGAAAPLPSRGVLQAAGLKRSSGRDLSCRDRSVLAFPSWAEFIKLFYLMCSCDSSMTFREGETSCCLLQHHQNGEAVGLLETARENV